MRRFFVCMAVIVIAVTSCSKSNEVTESGKSDTTVSVGCDTVNMKYTTNVQPIILANCYGCHGNGQSKGGVSLDSYNALKQHVDNSSLIGAVTHAAGYAPMPLGAAKLSDCDINKIKAWIARGALNN